MHSIAKMLIFCFHWLMLHIQKSLLLYCPKAIFASSSINCIDRLASFRLWMPKIFWKRKKWFKILFFFSIFYLAYLLSLIRYMKDKLIVLYVLIWHTCPLPFYTEYLCSKKSDASIADFKAKVKWYCISVWCVLTDIQSNVLDASTGTILFLCFLDCPHLTFFSPSSPPIFLIPLRNQAMRKKLILYFKRRNHARKQWVSLECNIFDSLLGPNLWRMTGVKLGQLLLEVSGHFRLTKKEQNMIFCQYCARRRKKNSLTLSSKRKTLFFSFLIKTSFEFTVSQALIMSLVQSLRFSVPAFGWD